MKKSVYLSLFVVAISAFFLLMSRMDREEAVLYSDPEMSMYDVDNEEAENEETEEYSEIDTAISEEIDEEEIGEEYPDVNASDEINDEEAEVENAEPEINESEIANDTMMTVSEAVSFSLPSDFTEIEYVTFTEGQYLDTNIDHLGDKTYNIKYLYTEKTSPTRFEILFGARPAASGGDKDAVSAEIRDPNLYWNYSKVGYPNSIGTDYWQVTTGNGGARNTVYERNFRQWTIYDEGMNALGSLNSVDNTPDANPIHIYLGALNKDNGAPIAGYWFRGNFYKFSIYDNDTSKMLIDLLPVQQISTSNIGFFDKVSGNFYLQNSSGAFTLLDVTAPTITAIIATPTTPTSGSVTVSIEATDNTELASQAYSFDDGATRQTDNRQAFSENQTLNIQVRDMAGNIATGSISFTTIDTSPVTWTVTYDIGTPTNEDVVASITFNKTGVIVTNNPDNTPATKYLFTGNGDFTFEFIDEAGNTGNAEALVDWIDKTPPVVQPSTSGGGGTSLGKDNCPNGDFSSSYYDNTCDDSSLRWGEVGADETHQEHNVAGEKSLYKTAYELAKHYGISTISTYEDARISDGILRQEMAKMISTYAIKLLNKIPDPDKVACAQFQDISEVPAELQPYIVQSCELGLMGMDGDGVGIQENFFPNRTITRAEVGTILSRLLRGEIYATQKGDETYYGRHLQALKKAGIMNFISNPDMLELRGNILLMLWKSVTK